MTPPSDIIHTTQSLCPVCLGRVEAFYCSRSEGVFFVKECPDHGLFEVPVWPDIASFEVWRRENPVQPPSNPANGTVKGCPYDCGLCESHKQATCCVLLEVTARCNLGCPICFASAGGEKDDPTLDTISGWYDMLLERGGPFNIQLSGGEPSLRDDLPDIIAMGREKGFEFFQLNTNGLRIALEPNYLHRLAQAGLNTVFLQFDTLSPEHCAELRGRDILAEKKQAIAHCNKENVGVVLVPTVKRSCNEGDLGDILRFAADNMPMVRGVHFQPISYFGRYGDAPLQDARVAIPELLAAIETQMAGQLKASDFMSGGAEHPLCSFHADYVVKSGHWTLQESDGNTGCCSCTGSDAARRAVAQKWTGIQPLPEVNMSAYGGININALDDFLAQKQTQTLAVSGMAFQDAWTVDLERLSRCYIHVVSPKGQLVPFCAYNLTAENGVSLYR